MKVEEINSHIDYKSIFECIVKSHLETYPNFNDYIEEFLNLDINQLDKSFGENISELYSIIKNTEKFYENNEGVCHETSLLNTEDGSATIVFYTDDSTSTENGFDYDFYLWIFEIDLFEGLIRKYSNDY